MPPIKAAVHLQTRELIPRKTFLRYTPSQLGQHNIDRIIRYYTNNTELSNIVAMINGPLSSHQTINLADCYTVLFTALHTKKIKQRKKHLSFELKLPEFAALIKLWRHGVRKNDIIKTFSKQRSDSKTGCERVIRALELRQRQETSNIETIETEAAKELLQLAKPTIINGRMAYVIYRDEVPPGLSKGIIFDDMNEEMLAEHIKLHGVSSGNIKEQILHQPQTQPSCIDGNEILEHRTRLSKQEILELKVEQFKRENHKLIEEEKIREELAIPVEFSEPDYDECLEVPELDKPFNEPLTHEERAKEEEFLEEVPVVETPEVEEEKPKPTLDDIL